MNLFSLKENENIKPLNVVSYAKLSNLELILNLFPLQLRYALPEGKKKKKRHRNKSLKELHETSCSTMKWTQQYNTEGRWLAMYYRSSKVKWQEEGQLTSVT